MIVLLCQNTIRYAQLLQTLLLRACTTTSTVHRMMGPFLSRLAFLRGGQGRFGRRAHNVGYIGTGSDIVVVVIGPACCILVVLVVVMMMVV